VQFKLEDVVFFYFDVLGKLRQLPNNATDEEILGACGATMKLDNQKNGWKGVCVFQETNEEGCNCPGLVLACRVAHIRHHTNNNKT